MKKHFVPLMVLLLGSLGNLYAQSTVRSSSLFDGKTLDGWRVLNPADEGLWKVEDDMIVGGDGQAIIKENSYLYTENTYEDFEFRCLFRISGDPSTGLINSGIQYRSNIENGLMVGYQADIGDGYWGDIYDEHRRGKLVGGDLSTLRHLLSNDGWNSYIIRVKGNRHELYINGVKTCDYLEENSTIPPKGVIAVQVHSGGKAKVEFKDMVIEEL
ncbi:DUF1080 domain-containing protein [Parapedobacter defluvii]|uniref:3-keto-disaccharide hydrolase n=1 Tax=Parapedobacter defluvii TaxID=2045106 RepID=UPI00334187DB